jgi:molybdopterin/thiamine biosynthesis adenylyltransferase
MFSKKELIRYDRQLRFISKPQQRKLKQSTATVVGLGGIGSAISLYLAAAGVSLRLIDSDKVELQNLHRQILYDEDDIGKFKADVAKRRLLAMNSEINVESHAIKLDEENAVEFLRGSNVVLDGLDNFDTRFIVNEACVKLGIPSTYAAAIQDTVSFTFMIPGKTPCLRCIFPKKPKDTKAEDVGVLGPTAGFVGVLSASQCINYLIGNPVIQNKLLYATLGEFSVELFDIKRRKDCEICR